MKVSAKHLSFLFSAVLSASLLQAAWVGDPAPAFELADLAGEKVTLNQHKGKVLFINFWASWCPPCKEEFPKLNELASSYEADEVAVLAITLDKALANIHRFLEKHGKGPHRLEILRDPEGKSAADYGARAMPISFVVDKKGVIRYVHMGFQKNDEPKWRQEIDTLIREGAQ